MTWRMFLQKSASSCATNMCWDSVQRTRYTTANGGGSRSSWFRQRDCLRCGFTLRLVTMRRRNNATLLIFLLTTLLLAYSQTGGAPSTQPQPSTPQPVSQASSGSQAPASSRSPNSGTEQSGTSPATDQAAPPNTAQSPDSGDNGVFVFKKQVEEVVLHASVIDNKQHIVTNLDKGNFTVYEGGHPQTITSFRHEDIPVAMCIVVDNSGSMREKRQKVNAAALNLVRASNPSDEVCIVNFNDEFYLDQEFTGNIKKLQEGLEKIETRGGTALYDAVMATATHLRETAKPEKRSEEHTSELQSL